jgi:hypothetical protein
MLSLHTTYFAALLQHFVIILFDRQKGPGSGVCTVHNISSYVHTNTRIHTYMHACLPTYLHTYIPTYLHAYMHTCIHAYMHPCIHASMHPCIHASIHYMQISIPTHQFKDHLMLHVASRTVPILRFRWPVDRQAVHLHQERVCGSREPLPRKWSGGKCGAKWWISVKSSSET